MSLRDFTKEYNTILLRYNKIQNSNYWERLNQPKAMIVLPS